MSPIHIASRAHMQMYPLSCLLVFREMKYHRIEIRTLGLPCRVFLMDFVEKVFEARPLWAYQGELFLEFQNA
jgi:hypothetical protein